MVAPVPAHISKLRPRVPAAALRRPLLTTHHSLPTLFFPVFKRSTPLLPIASLQPQQFHAITHSFAQRRAAIPPIFNGFRTLSIATGAYPSIIPDDNLSGFQRVNAFVYKSLEPLCRLFALFPALVSFIFNGLRPLFRKHPGWGYPECSYSGSAHGGGDEICENYVSSSRDLGCAGDYAAVLHV